MRRYYARLSQSILFLVMVLSMPLYAAECSKDIVETAVSAGSFKTLVAALKAAGLVETLKGTGPYTVFAPTDEAFGKLPEGTLESLLQPKNKDKLAAILKLHVVPGRLIAKDVLKTPLATTAQGTTILFSKNDHGAKVDNANIVKTDIFATNGVIHVIDKVLLPKNLAQTAQMAGQFNTLLAAAKAAGLTEALGDPKANLTVFAPTDKAFESLPPGTVNDLLKPENKDRLVAILKFHIVPSRIILTDRSENSLEGDQLQIRSGGPIQVDEAKVVLADIKTTNGVIHIIDQVLIPELPEQTSVRKAMSLIELAIERGVPLFNAHKPEACAAIYEVTVQSLLNGHSQALSEKDRKRLADSLKAISKDHSSRKKAWTLRYALDDIYRSLIERETEDKMKK